MTRADRSAGQLQLLAAEAPLPPEHPSIRVLIPCSKWKVAAPETASREDLDHRRDATHERLTALAQPARDLYTGRSYTRALAAVDQFAEARPDLPIALHIASAGYGIVEAHTQVVPYEAVMGSGARQLAERGRKLGMPDSVTRLVETCDVAILALSQPYFIGADIPSLHPAEGHAVVIGVGQASPSPRIQQIIASRPQARGLRTTEREVASVVLDLLLKRIARHGIDVVRNLSADPLEWAS